MEYVKQTDECRVHYLKRHFNRSIDDPSLYHLVINTDAVTPEESVVIIGRLVLDRQETAKKSANTAG